MKGEIVANSIDLDGLEAAYYEIARRGAIELNLDILAPRYHFSQLNDVKPDMLREATENARIAAEEFAQNVGTNVGGIQEAGQGGFQVSDVDNQK